MNRPARPFGRGFALTDNSSACAEEHHATDWTSLRARVLQPLATAAIWCSSCVVPNFIWTDSGGLAFLTSFVTLVISLPILIGLLVVSAHARRKLTREVSPTTTERARLEGVLLGAPAAAFFGAPVVFAVLDCLSSHAAIWFFAVLPLWALSSVLVLAVMCSDAAVTRPSARRTARFS